MTPAIFLYIIIVMAIAIAATAIGYSMGKKDADQYWKIYVDKLLKKHSEEIRRYEDKIFKYSAEAVVLQETVQKVKEKQKATKTDYEKALSFVDSFTVSQLERFFADRYGNSPFPGASKISYQRPGGAGLPQENGTPVTEGTKNNK